MKGCIRKRSKNSKSWSVVVDAGRDPVTGKRKQVFRTVKGTKADAERELRAILTGLDSGLYIESTKQTVRQYLNTWLQDYAKDNTSPRTFERYKEIVDKHLVPALGSIQLSKLHPQHIKAYYKKALSEGRRDGKGGLSARTVHHNHRILFQALKYAVKENIIARNVAEAVDPPRPVRKEMNIVGAEGLNRILEAAKDTPYYVLFYTSAYTGLRRSELLALRWHNVDLDYATISVVESLHRLHNQEFVFRQPKSNRSRRMIALSPSLAVLLREYKAEQAALKHSIGLVSGIRDLVFSQIDGSPIDPNSITKSFRKLVKSIGINGIRFHDLRHTHASLMLQQGIHPKIVSERLGHSSINITLDTYSHVLPGLQEAAALRFEEGLRVKPLVEIKELASI